MGQEVDWAVLAEWGEVAMACVSRREVMGGEGVRGGCSPWESGEDQLLGGGTVRVSGRKAHFWALDLPNKGSHCEFLGAGRGGAWGNRPGGISAPWGASARLFLAPRWSQ